jgi:hypothetical protein
MISRPNVLIIYPSRSPIARSTASLHRVPWGGFPDFNGTISRLRLLVLRPAALRCLRSAVPSLCPSSFPRLGTTPEGLDCFYRGARTASLQWRKRGLPGSWATLAHMPRSSTPADRLHPATSVQTMLPSAKLTTSAPHSYHSRGSITRPIRSLCTLRSRGRPRTTQHSVPAGGQPLPGQDLHLLGRIEGFCHGCPST